MADYTPVFADGVKPFTSTASATITGGVIVEASSTGAVATAGVGSVKFVGVAAHDAASGAKVTVWPLTGVVHEVTHTAGGSVGDCLTVAANGLLATTAVGTAAAAGSDIGNALTTAGAGAKMRFIGR